MLLSSAGVLFVAELAVWATHVAQHTDAVLLPDSLSSPASSKQLITHNRSHALSFIRLGYILLFLFPCSHFYYSVFTIFSCINFLLLSYSEELQKRCPLCEVIFPPNYDQSKFEEHVESHWKVCPMCSEQFPLDCDQQLFEKHVLTHFDGNVLNFD